MIFCKKNSAAILLLLPIFFFSFLGGVQPVRAIVDCEKTDTSVNIWSALWGSTGAPSDPAKLQEAVQGTLCQPQPRITIPGLSFTPIETVAKTAHVDAEGNLYVEIPYIGEYIKAIYRFLIIAGGVVAVVMIVVAGVQWVGAAGSQETIKKAQERILHALTGVVLIATSYLILTVINPSLTSITNLGIRYVASETINTEGEPDTSPNPNIKIVPGTLTDLSCNLAQLPTFAKDNTLFGQTVGKCLRWVKEAFSSMCGAVPEILSQPGAWDAAAAFVRANQFHPCNLDGIKDGDIVFETSMGSDWVGLWENFRVGPDKCTIADAKTNPTRMKNGIAQKAPPVIGLPKGMPPVTHIGIYYQGHIYHLLKSVSDDEAGSATYLENQTRSGKVQFKGLSFTGNFVRHNSLFIAGYGSWDSGSDVYTGGQPVSQAP